MIKISFYKENYSHSIVPVGFGVKSYNTLLTFGTSVVILLVICCKSSKGMFSTVAVMASTVFTARIITGYAKVLFPSETPTDLKSGTAVKYCQTLPSNPFLANSSLKIASD